MKIHRFIGEFDLSKTDLVIANTEIVHQLTHVLRVKIGEKIILCDGQGKEATVHITEVQKGKIITQIDEILPSIAEISRKVTLYAAIVKGEHFEMIVEKATEMGVSEVVPLHTHRTIKLGFKYDRVQKIMREAAEQSGRGIIPTLTEPLDLKDALRHAAQNEKNFFCDFESTPIFECDIQKLHSVGCFIGPEGGWDQEERDLAQNAECAFVSLSQFTYRAETAAITSTFFLCQ